MAVLQDRHSGPCPACGSLAIRVERGEYVECPGCRRVNYV